MTEALVKQKGGHGATSLVTKLLDVLVGPNPLLMLRDCLLPRGVLRNQLGVETELHTREDDQFIQNFLRLLNWETIVESWESNLIPEAKFVLWSAAIIDVVKIFVGERCLLGEFLPGEAS